MAYGAKSRTHPPKDLSDQALGWIVRLHSGEASSADWNAFQVWRAQSAGHEAAAAEAEALWRDVSDLHRDPVTGLVRVGRQGRGPSRRNIIGGLAGLAVAGGAGMWASGAGRSWNADAATGTAQTRVIELDDGSRVTLNAMSAIDIDYRPDLRRIELTQGQAFFEVAPDSRRPFVVGVDDSQVRALGTAFDINRNLPGGRIAIAVTQHSVRIDTPSMPDFVLKEGQRLVILPDGRFGLPDRQDAEAAIAWRNGLYVAEERRLDEVVAAFDAYYQGWIVVQGASTKALRVNAVLDLTTPDASLDALAKGLPVRVRRISNYLTVITGT